MHSVSDSDLRFSAKFESCDLSGAEFGHREHLRIAYVYLAQYPFDEASKKMERGLRKLLAHLDAPPSKFHATVTQAWLLATRDLMTKCGTSTDFEQFLAAGGAPLLSKAMMNAHYSAETLRSEEARKRLVAPDRKPFPTPSRVIAPLSFLSPKSAVRESAIHGRGLFAVEAIAEGEVVAVKGGHIISDAMLQELRRIVGPAEIQIDDDLFICPVTADEREGSMIFSNHSCEPNIGVRGQITFVAMRDISAGEELTHDWAMTDDDDSVTACRCGAGICRGTISGQDWRKPELQARYRGYFSAYLIQKIEATAR